MTALLDHPFMARLRLGLRTFAGDVGQGFFAITHNGMALVGLSIFVVVVAMSVRPDLRTVAEARLISWLQERQYDSLGMTVNPDAVDRATASDPRDLPKQQSNLAYWLSRKYRVAPEPLSSLITEAYELGPKNGIDPTLILAVMAVESSFNPFAQSQVGAQGLMQVMTKVHADKYLGFGGTLAAFDPVANLRVGVLVLRECVQRAGSLEGGLRLYVGEGNNKEDTGYAAKVMAEQRRLLQVAKGVKVPTTETTSAAQAATQRLESLWEKAQRLSPFGGDKDKAEE